MSLIVATRRVAVGSLARVHSAGRTLLGASQHARRVSVPAALKSAAAPAVAAQAAPAASASAAAATSSSAGAPKGKGTAVVMLNMGGPASVPEVRPFLDRLFSDGEIIQLGPFQKW